VLADSLFFVYVAKNNEWMVRQEVDGEYVLAMSRFFHKWIKRSFNVNMSVVADILPVIPGKIFDRMSVSYLARDHLSRGKTVYHFYLAYFKPFWTDCQTEGYSSENFGMVHWDRPKNNESNSHRTKYYADNNCLKVSHVLSHEIMRMKGYSRKIYFDGIHELWDRHLYKDLPLQYYNNKYDLVSKEETYSYVTIDIKKLGPVK
jgi:hypothetical protein